MSFGERVAWWLANSPIASILKVGVAASLGWYLANPDVLDLPPVVAVAVTAMIPLAVNALNPGDHRYGVESSRRDERDEASW